MSSTAATAGEPAKAGGKPRKKLTVEAIGRRMASIKQMDDKAKAKKGRRRLLQGLLKGIADGSIEDPAKAAEAFLTHAPGKRAGEADDE